MKQANIVKELMYLRDECLSILDVTKNPYAGNFTLAPIRAMRRRVSALNGAIKILKATL
jgi:hypothetical protein